MLQPGSRVANYTVLREIARGGQGQVVEAEHGTLGTRVAIKVLLDDEAEFARRFAREAQALAQLEHPNLVRVHDCGRLPTGAPYMVMDLIDGRDLKSRVREAGPFAPGDAARVLSVVARTLAHCHARGVIHRDVKPQNILLERGTGRPVLVDFGLIKRDRAHWQTLAGSLTRPGDVLGTPAYMAPEQADAQAYGPSGPWSDVYGLGATLYYLLTGQAPFRGASVINVLSALLEQPAPDPRAVRPELPRSLSELCLACLAKHPAERPPSAQACADRLEQALTPPRPRSALAAGAVLLLALTFAATAGFRSTGPTPTASGEAQRMAAEQALAENRPSDALRAADAALAIASSDAKAWAIRAVALAHSDRAEDALSSAERAVQLAPESASSWYARGVARLALGDADAAADLSRATELAPSESKLWGTLAKSHADFAIDDPSRLPLAQVAAERALQIDPTQAGTRAVLADCLRLQGDTAGAYTHYKQCVNDIDPDPSPPEFARALLLRLASLERERSDPDAEAKYLDLAIAWFPDDPMAFRLRGDLRRRLGEPRAGYEDVQAALALAPDHVATCYLAAQLACEVGAYEDARKLLRRLPAKAPSQEVRNTIRRLRQQVRDALGED